MSRLAAKPLKMAFFSVVPSPYQRDIFRALSSRRELDLRVFYLEHEAPDSPWPHRPLAPYEEILPGAWFPLGSARIHINRLPDLRGFDLVVLNTLMSITAQWLMRVVLRRQRWIFWGERLNRGNRAHRLASAPLNRATGIVGIGSWAERDYRERFPSPRHFNEPYCCDLEEFLAIARPRPTRSEFVFLFCGQMIARKGVDTLLQAFDLLTREHSSARLMLVGREADLPNFLAGLPAGTRDRITYCGFQPPEALPAFFAKADAFVLPSRYDGWGVVINQALAAGLPIVCSDRVGAGVDYVIDGANGRKFPAGDETALADAMRQIAADRPGAEKWGAHSRVLADKLKPERSTDRWLDIFQALGWKNTESDAGK